jgi:isoleucyl-tRNA synthetase
VKEVVAKVLLPLWNSYKFFEGQVALLKKVAGVDFIFDPASESTNTNVMDQWILASCQSLLKFVNEEMAGRLNISSRCTLLTIRKLIACTRSFHAFLT